MKIVFGVLKFVILSLISVVTDMFGVSPCQTSKGSDPFLSSVEGCHI